MWSAMAARDRTAEDTIRVCQETFDGWLRKLPRFALGGIGRLLMSAPARWTLERQAARSQKRRYAEDFVWRLERGPVTRLVRPIPAARGADD